MSDGEYQNCIANLGLLEGERVRLEYVCHRNEFDNSGKGLLVFTTNSMIFMQQAGAWSTDYSQAIRAPLEEIIGIVSGGIQNKHIRIKMRYHTGFHAHEFNGFFMYSSKKIEEIRQEIERLVSDVRNERRKVAQEALAAGTVPQMIFCKFCGARNKSDSMKCGNCGALL